MDISNDYTNINFDTKKSETYLNKLNELNGSVNLLLDEFKQVYVMYKMYPANERPTSSGHLRPERCQKQWRHRSLWAMSRKPK